MAWTPSQFRFAGGLNEEDPQWAQAPGSLALCQNVECLPGGGYRRVEGYERFDGHVAKPSLATYSYLSFSAGGPRQITAGDTITGATSGATAHVVGTTEVTSGEWASSDVVGNIGITAISGTFQSGETITIGGIYAATLTSAVVAGSIGDASYKSWLAGARDYYRTLISAPAGSGAVRGGFVLNSNVYCIRDNVGASAAILYKATTAGWVAVTMSQFIRFNTGVIEVTEGQTIAGGTSGATAVVRRINIGAGNYTGPTYASGRFTVDTVTGTWQAAEAIKVGGTTVATSAAVLQTSGFSPGGRFECVVTNFYGASDHMRAYGCDGVNRAFEFDDSVSPTIFTFIETGMTTDTPNHIEKHRGHLFLSFAGGSLQNSGTGTPLIWSPRLGAGEIGIGDDVTGIKSNGNNTLAITASKSIGILNGTSDLDWSLRPISDEIGSVAYTMQEAGGQTLFLDRAGINIVIPVPTTYQDVGTQSISRVVRKTIEAKAPLAVDSLHAVKKSQYRLFFSDKTALIATFYGSKLAGFTKCQYPHQISCSWAGTDSNGVERMYCGTSDGYVMELDSGTSFDGSAIESIQQLPYNSCKSPDRDKRFHKLVLELETPRAIDLRISTDFNYGVDGQSGQFAHTSEATGGLWDTSSWESFFWDSPILSRPEVNIDGIGFNIGITLYHSDAVDDAFSVSAGLLSFTNLAVRR